MDMKLNGIQPIAPDARVASESLRPDGGVIPPVAKSEGSAFRSIGHHSKAPDGTNAGEFLDPERQAELAEQIQSYLEDDLNIELNFNVEEKTGDLIVKLVNRDTGEVIRQIPAENLVKLREKLEELRGVLFDDKV